MSSFPPMSNMIHIGHRSNSMSNCPERKRSIIGHLFLSRKETPQTSPPLSDKMSADKTLSANAQLSKSSVVKPDLDILTNNRPRCISVSSAVQSDIKGFDHHHANFQRDPTPQFDATKDFLQNTSNGAFEVMRTLFGRAIIA